MHDVLEISNEVLSFEFNSELGDDLKQVIASALGITPVDVTVLKTEKTIVLDIVSSSILCEQLKQNGELVWAIADALNIPEDEIKEI